MEGVAWRGGGERLFCIIHRNGGLVSDEFVTGSYATNKMRLVYNRLDDSKALGTKKIAIIRAKYPIEE